MQQPAREALDQRAPLPRAFAASALALCVVLTSANLSTPLYPLWAARWGFSTAVLTIVFAAYVIGIIGVILLAGRLSDALGRRRVLLPALACSFAGAVMLFLARGVEWLIVARALQGIAVGATAGTATAALSDYAPEDKPGRAAIVGSFVSVGGLSFGPLIAGMVSSLGFEPDAIVWPIDMVMIAASGSLVMRYLPQTRTFARAAMRFQRISVPRGIRLMFAGCAGVFLHGWVATAFFLALGSTFVHDMLHRRQPVIGGLAVFGVFAASGLAQLLVRLTKSRNARRDMFAGMAAMAAGTGLFLTGLAQSSLLLFACGSVCVGAGQGISYVGSLASLQAVTPVTHRGEVMGAYYLAGYAGVAVFVPAAGFLASSIGLLAAVSCVSGALMVSGVVASAVLFTPACSQTFRELRCRVAAA
ncbi:MAG TPA: MFS transporter [Ramlibacter sp.]|uniref:MFS transporter n=1 Tax=Ramlibacter sp. TaxID=1917967 RepID=UPI002CA843EC|nr:MFS transporter [Ramlibacter sp.]HVZ46611.1 MFS transporter [Ramlibacter sp.]